MQSPEDVALISTLVCANAVTLGNTLEDCSSVSDFVQGERTGLGVNLK